MKRTILLIMGLVLILSLCRTDNSHAVSDKKMEKIARKAEEAITEAQTSLTQWRTADLIAPPEANEILDKAQTDYKAGSYKEARNLAEESLKISSDKDAWKLAQKTKETITQAQGYINLWEKEGCIPPPEARETLEKARQSYQAYNNEEAYQLACQSLKITSDEGLKKQAEKAKEAIDGAEAGITRCESAGYSVPEAKEILGKARQANESGNYKEAYKLAKDSLIASSAKKVTGPVGIKPKKVEKAIKKVEKKIAEWESEIQIPVPEAKRSLAEARSLYQAGNYEKAYKSASQAYGFLGQAIWAEKYIRKAEAYIIKWEYAGYNVPRAKKLLADARQAQKEGDYPKTRKMASEATASLKHEMVGTSEPVVEFYSNPEINLSKYKKVIIQTSDDKGEAISNLISQALVKKGYHVVGRKEDADAILSPTLLQYDIRGTYYYLGTAATGYGYRKKETYSITTVHLILSMKDAKTNAVVWQGTGKQEVVSEEIVPVAQRVIDAILDKIPLTKY